MEKKNGFTLIELLAVIVILGVIMIIAIPSVTSYITNARKDSYVSDAKMFLDAAKTQLTADSTLPHSSGEQYVILVTDIALDKGGEKSPFGNDWVAEKSYVIVENIGTSSDPEYVWKVALEDVKGNCIPLTLDKNLKREVVGTGCAINEGSTGSYKPYLNPNGTIPAGATYYSGVTSFNSTTFEVVATNTYTEGDSFPAIKNGDVYVYGDYIYKYSNGGSGSSYSEDGDGWKVYVRDKTKSSYGEILESINNYYIKDLAFTFEGCRSLVAAPKIPSTVTSMASTFQTCVSLIYPPVIPEGVKSMTWTFNYTSIVNAPVIPSTVTNMQGIFNNCKSLTGNVEINTNTTSFSDAFGLTTLPIKIVGSASAETKAALAATAKNGNVTY